MITVPDANGVTPGQLTVAETDGAMGGSFTISAQAGIASLNVGGTVLTLAQLNALGGTPVSITTADGTLTLTGYDAGTGVVSYTFDPVVHSSNADVLANFPLTLTDANNVPSAGNLGITITDSKPVAVADVNTITEDSSPNTVSGNVLPNDAVGADSNATPVTAGTFVSGNGYGTLVLNSNGSYTYTLNNANPTVNALNDNSTPLTDSFTYTLTDGDGSTTTAVLSITINGHTDGTPVITVPDANGVTPGQLTVAETDGAMGGSFTISAQAGIASLNVGGTVLTLAQLNALGGTPVSITTADGTLTLTGYDAGTGVVSYTFDPVVHSSNADVLANFPLTLTDANNVPSAGNLGITITDSKPVAVADVNTITEDSSPNTVSGNVLPNDAVGADSNATPVTAGHLRQRQRLRHAGSEQQRQLHLHAEQRQPDGQCAQ